jgi:ABC-type antimicrobial peptide transport system permease subunit
MRTNEFGVRLALGATARDIARLVLAATTTNVAAGLLIGIALSVALSKFFTAWVNESSRDPLLLSAVAAALLLAAITAAIIPVRRAASTDPLTALRHE